MEMQVGKMWVVKMVVRVVVVTAGSTDFWKGDSLVESTAGYWVSDWELMMVEPLAGGKVVRWVVKMAAFVVGGTVAGWAWQMAAQMAALSVGNVAA